MHSHIEQLCRKLHKGTFPEYLSQTKSCSVKSMSGLIIQKNEGRLSPHHTCCVHMGAEILRT